MDDDCSVLTLLVFALFASRPDSAWDPLVRLFGTDMLESNGGLAFKVYILPILWARLTHDPMSHLFRLVPVDRRLNDSETDVKIPATPRPFRLEYGADGWTDGRTDHEGHLHGLGMPAFGRREG